MALNLNLLKSPFLWFLLAGASLFALEAWLNPSDEAEAIIIDGRTLARISALWQQQAGRPPSRAELGNLAISWAEEEMLFREAKRLGLDTEDIIVRRRLIQKLQFIADQAQVAHPDDPTLEAWYKERQEDYRQPPRYTFTQLFYRTPPAVHNSPRRGGVRQRKALAGGGATSAVTTIVAASAPVPPESDASMLARHWTAQSQRALAAEFGPVFAEAIASLRVADGWQGPIQSEFGWHLVRLTAVQESALPPFPAIRQKALNDYLFEARAAAREAQLATLRPRYQIIWQAP